MTLDRRTRMKPLSDRRRSSHLAYEQVKTAVYERDRQRCRLAYSLAGACWGTLTPHHLHKAGQGGPDHPCNLISLCQFHNGLVETMPRADAEALGLVVRRGETIGHAWRRLVFWGLVGYWFDGTPLTELEPVHVDDLYQRVRR